MHTKEVIERIFKEPGLQYELKEFENLGKPFHEILNIYPKVVETGWDAGKTKYFLKSLVPHLPLVLRKFRFVLKLANRPRKRSSASFGCTG